MEIPADIKTSKTAIAKGVCKTLGYEAQLGVYSLLWQHAKRGTGSSDTEPPPPSGWDCHRIRASSVWNWVDCPLRAHSENNLGMRKAASSRMHLGTVIHRSTAVYDGARVLGTKPSVNDAISCAVDTLWHPDEEVDWGDETPRMLEPIARESTRKYCQYSRNLTFSGVEETLANLDVDVPSERIRITLTGTQDRLRRTVKRKDTDANYAEVIGIRTSKNPEIAVATIPEPEKVLLGDESHGGYIQWLAQMLRSGNIIGNPRSMFCSKRGCAIFPCFYARGG